MIHAKNVGFEYFRRDSDGEVIEVIPALKDVSMQVQPGDFVAVLGANGSGKSTFAKHLCALLTPGEGTILVAGMDTADEEKHLQIRQTAGMVFQNPDNQLVAGVVEEDVAFGPENIGVESRQIWQRVEESLQSVGMAHIVMRHRCICQVDRNSVWRLRESWQCDRNVLFWMSLRQC
ncbi:MAG: ATP-binding cassette domain-containing protein [Clostridium sp.]